MIVQRLQIIGGCVIFCFKCGARISDESVFCQKCGARQPAEKEEASFRDEDDLDDEEGPPFHDNESYQKWIEKTARKFGGRVLDDTERTSILANIEKSNGKRDC